MQDPDFPYLWVADLEKKIVRNLLSNWSAGPLRARSEIIEKTGGDSVSVTLVFMLSAYFVSDIHIASPESRDGRLFASFLRSLSGKSNITHLYLLGDIFDLWVADHCYFVDRYREIISEIRRLKTEGVEVSYFEGNHDLYLRYFWADQLGVTVHDGPIDVRLGETAVHLEHGDQMDPDDKGYLFLRWFLRTSPIRILVRHLPGSLIRRIGEKASATSRQYTSHKKAIKPVDAITKIHAHARRAYAREPFDLIITGHVHVRDDCCIDTETGTFRSVNLGSWRDAPCCFRLDHTEAEFKELTEAGLCQFETQNAERRPGVS